MVILTALLAAWTLFFLLLIYAVVRWSRYVNLRTRRLYLDPSLSLAERKRILEREKSGHDGQQFYDYYLIMEGDEMPVFGGSDLQLARAEFLIIEYVESKQKIATQ